MKSAPKGGETFIAQGVKVEGDFASEGSVHIDGIVKGNVTAAGDVTVGETAVIDADVVAVNASIAGTVRGNVRIQGTTNLAATSTLEGDLQTKTLSVAPGAKLNGRIVMAETAAAPAVPKTEEKEA